MPQVIPGWRQPRPYRKAIKVLLERQVWIRTREGGRGAHDPHEYRFAPGGLLQAKGAENAPNTNSTPSPLPSCPELQAPLIRASGMNQAQSFDANARLAQIALWLDEGVRWMDRATEQAQANQRGTVTVTFNRAELAAFLSGFRGVSRALLGIAQPVPPPLPRAPKGGPPHLRLVEAGVLSGGSPESRSADGAST